MKKILLMLILTFVGNSMFSQKAMTRKGVIKFEASKSSFEEIAATNNSVSCILDQSNGNFVVLALVKSFRFKSPLMEEHFNENYMESSKFPKTSFKGKIVNFDASKLTSTNTIYVLEGDLTLHGVTKKIKSKIILSLNSGKINAKCDLLIKPQDYNIDIPGLVKNKIAESVKISINLVLEAGN